MFVVAGSPLGRLPAKWYENFRPEPIGLTAPRESVHCQADGGEHRSMIDGIRNYVTPVESAVTVRQMPAP